MPLSVGDRLSRYEIRGFLGAGGMGEVYRALDTRLDREVAIKVLPQELTHDTDRLRRFEREARAAAALNHPNILDVHDLGVAERQRGEPAQQLVAQLAQVVDLLVERVEQLAQGRVLGAVGIGPEQLEGDALAAAHDCADRLGLEMDIEPTGYGELETTLVEFTRKVAAS